MEPQSISESYIAWVERESDKHAGKRLAQYILRRAAESGYNAGMLTPPELAHILRRIESNL